MYFILTAHGCSNKGGWDSNSDVCFCTTKGMLGDDCDTCDTANNFYGDSIKESCFYDLNNKGPKVYMSFLEKDRYFSRINFRYSPLERDFVAYFSISCSESAKMDISIISGNCNFFIFIFCQNHYFKSHVSCQHLAYVCISPYVCIAH